MERDAKAQRKDRPFVFTDLLRNKGVAETVQFLERHGGLG
jgi:urease accessory protein